jgi:membrane-bound metal-dependent hydrolase YbcI (DUF457 family)
MMFITHMSIALFIGMLKVRLLELPVNEYVFLAILVFSALIPDIDAGFFLGKKIIKGADSLFEHRGFFHSIIPMVVLMVLVFVVTKNSYYSLAVLIGFGSHLAFDSLTKKGIAWFWPSKLRIRGKHKTGNLFDWSLFGVFITADIVLLFSWFI